VCLGYVLLCGVDERRSLRHSWRAKRYFGVRVIGWHTELVIL
jgi:hypothetical protein